ncbi:SDR family NAD(P)-dependent oxidoreductase [Mycolicibacterium tusciae]|uniref:SDR family NAD(P)-dependent oxidoreductase n=1 Tax=Mycolicibacterium tusciae TaxID=75922 RepID=UPI00024A3ED1|nr:SDR family NAD(P)-dependent oxidoreductase [Mycolicibacterium tusciae]
MTHRQRPLESGFTASSTADDVLRGLDLSGTNVIVTAGHVGLGLETTRALSKAGAAVTVAARHPDRAAAALDGMKNVDVDQLDLLDPESIDAFARRYLASGRGLHVLLNNAGIMGGDLVRDARGYEAQFATNHLGHFQLTLRLLPALRAAGHARVVNVSSGGHAFSDIRWDDPHFTTGYDGLLGYGQSKTANVLFAVELDRRWRAEGIRGYALHPGIAYGTSLGPSITDDELRAMGVLDDDGNPVVDPEHEFKTLQQGASTSVFAAAHPLLDDIGGVYLKDNDIAVLNESELRFEFGTEPLVLKGVAPHAVNPESARRLWDLSERLIA